MNMNVAAALATMALCSTVPSTLAFQQSPITFGTTTRRISISPSLPTTTLFQPNVQSSRTSSSESVALFMADEKKKKLDSEVRSRLISESIAPWRTLRLFLYISLGSGAFLGGLITASGVAAALSGVRDDVDFNTEYLNLAIDFGAVAAFAFLTKYDLDRKNELDTKVAEKLESTKKNKVVRAAMKERELALQELELDIRVAEDGSTTRAKIEAIQSGGKQHIIIVAGPRKAIRNALLGANILKMEFSIRDVLIVPYELVKNQANKSNDQQLGPEGSGFATDKRPTWESQPYVAQYVGGDEWSSYIEAELQDAVTQNGEKVKEDGIAIVVANTGEIIRRGVGQVPWRDMVEELEKKVKEEDMLDLEFLSG